MTLREEAGAIIEYAISKVQPRIAVERALENLGEVQGRLVVIAIGKAAWQMGKASADILGNKIAQGIVITKYGNSRATTREAVMTMMPVMRKTRTAPQ